MPRGVNPVDEAIHQNQLWTPDVLSPYAWWDAADHGSISAPAGVSEWRDKSGNGKTLSQSTQANRPTLTLNALNGLPVVTFDGTNDVLNAATASDWTFLHNSTGSTVIAVVKVGTTSNPNAAYLFLGNNGTSSGSIGYALYFDDTAADSANDRLASNITNGTPAFPSVSNINDNVFTFNTPHVVSAVSDPSNATAANRQFAYIDSGSALNSNTFTQAVSTSAPTYTLQLGSAGNTILLFKGYVAEVCIFNRILSNADRLRVEGYMVWKWGLRSSVSATNPYINFPPTRSS
jgi:hypothetical protein